MKQILILLVILFLITGCTSNITNLAPSSNSISKEPEFCNVLETEDAMRKLTVISDKFVNLMDESKSYSSVGLAKSSNEVKALYSEYKLISVPPCVESAKSNMFNVMVNSSIMLDFMSRGMLDEALKSLELVEDFSYEYKSDVDKLIERIPRLSPFGL